MRLVLACAATASLLLSAVGPRSHARAATGRVESEGPPAAGDVEGGDDAADAADAAPSANKAAPPAATAKGAAARSAAGLPSIGYFDMNKALNSVHDAQLAKDKLQSEFASRQKALDDLQTSIKTEQDEFMRRAQLMTAEQRAEKERQLQERMLGLRQTYMKLQQELMEQEAKLTQQISDRLKEAVRAVAQQHAYDVVFNVDNNVLVYPNDRDITFKVIAAYNNAYGGPKK